MTSQEEYLNQVNRGDAGVTDLLGSMLGLAAAGTKFTFQQMENAMSMFTDSQGVMNRVRNSIDNISSAMTQEGPASRAATAAAEPTPAETFTGRKA